MMRSGLSLCFCAAICIAAVTAQTGPCDGGTKPKCSDGNKPVGCSDGSITLPCSSGARAVCSDGNNPSCDDPAIVATTTRIAAATSANDAATGGFGATIAPPSTRTLCPTEPPYYSVEVTTTSGGLPQVTTSSCPPYVKGWNNPADAYGTRSTITIPKPVFATSPIPVGKELQKYNDIMYLVDDGTALGGSLGVMRNGVEIFGRYSPCGFGSKCKTQDGCPSAARNCQVDANAPSNIVDAVDAESSTVDVCGGHPAPTGGYHIHTFHTGNRTICGDDQYLPHDTPGQHSEQLGWMYDGFEIYGPNSQNGQLPTVLDDCNGHTHMINGKMTYHYHFTGSYPWTIGCFKGCVSSTMVRNIDNLAQYGCPTGTTTDPNPTIEVVGNATVLPPMSTNAPTSEASSVTQSSTTANNVEPTTLSTRCGGDTRPLCSDGRRPPGCDDNTTSLPCTGGARPICADGQRPQCSNATGSTRDAMGSTPSTRPDQPTHTTDPQPTLAPSHYPTEPNIVYIMVDDLGYGDVGYTQADSSNSVTPNIDSFANESLILSRFYASATCTPTRGALMTGRYPFKLGLDDLTLGAASLYELPPTMTTLPSALKSLGYTTACVGKWHLGFASPDAAPIGKGFDYHYGYYEGGIDYFNKTGGTSAVKFYDLQYNGAAVTNQTEIDIYGPDLWDMKATAWMMSPSAGPKFLYYAMQSIHSPIHTPPSTIPACNNDDYCNMVAYADAKIGMFLTKLRASPAWDNTVVMLTSDNGGAVPLGGSNAPFAGSKGTWQEGGVHLPAMIGGGVLPPAKQGATATSLVHVTDLYATALALASRGLYEMQVDVDGFNLWPSIASSAVHPRDSVLIGLTSSKAAIITNNFKLLDGVMIRGTSYDGLYDLSTDTREERDLSASQAPVKQAMLSVIARLRELRTATVDTGRDMQAATSAANTAGGYWVPWLAIRSTRAPPSTSQMLVMTSTSNSDVSSTALPAVETTVNVASTSQSMSQAYDTTTTATSMSPSSTVAGDTTRSTTTAVQDTSISSTTTTSEATTTTSSSAASTSTTTTTTTSAASTSTTTTTTTSSAASTSTTTTSAASTSTTTAIATKKIVGRFVLNGVTPGDIEATTLARVLARMLDIPSSWIRILGISLQDARRDGSQTAVDYEVSTPSTVDSQDVADRLDAGLGDGSFTQLLQEDTPALGAVSSQVSTAASVSDVNQPSKGSSDDGAVIGGALAGVAVIAIVAAMLIIHKKRVGSRTDVFDKLENNRDVNLYSNEVFNGQQVYDQPNPPNHASDMSV